VAFGALLAVVAAGRANPPSITQTMTAALAEFSVGGENQLTYSLTNDGDGTATHVVATIDFPATVEVTGATTESSTCTFTPSQVTCDFGSVPSRVTVAASITILGVSVGTVAAGDLEACATFDEETTAGNPNPADDKKDTVCGLSSPFETQVRADTDFAGGCGETVLSTGGAGATGDNPLQTTAEFSGTVCASIEEIPGNACSAGGVWPQLIETFFPSGTTGTFTTVVDRTVAKPSTICFQADESSPVISLEKCPKRGPLPEKCWRIKNLTGGDYEVTIVISADARMGG
jgi:hypothetical protein